MPNSIYLFKLPNGAVVQEGTGTAEAVVSGVLTVNTTQAGTGANTNETDLWTYSLPANTLSRDQQVLRVTVFATFAANANTKTLRLYWGSSGLTLNNSTTAPNNQSAEFVATFLRTGAATQRRSRGGFVGSTFQGVTAGTDTQDLTAAVTIKVTGQNGTGVANDIVFNAAIVEALN